MPVTLMSQMAIYLPWSKLIEVFSEIKMNPRSFVKLKAKCCVSIFNASYKNVIFTSELGYDFQ